MAIALAADHQRRLNGEPPPAPPPPLPELDSVQLEQRRDVVRKALKSPTGSMEFKQMLSALEHSFG